MNNLRLYGGRVPILTHDKAHPILLVDFPTWEVFDTLFGKRVTAQNRSRYFEMLVARSKGATLTDVAKSQGVTKERVRQVEAKFLRLMRQQHQRKQIS